MASLQYRSSKANPPGIASAKTRKAMQQRIILRGVRGDFTPEVGRQLYLLAAHGHITRASAYGYHPTKSSKRVGV
jgi:hypothetical protein